MTRLFLHLISEERHSIVDRRLDKPWGSFVLFDTFQVLESLLEGFQVFKVIKAVFVQFEVLINQFVDNEVHEGDLFGERTQSIRVCI